MSWGLKSNSIGKGFLTPSDLVTSIDIKQSNLIHQWKALNNIKHFTAHDVISRWNIVSVYSRATAITAALFLDTLESKVGAKEVLVVGSGGIEKNIDLMLCRRFKGRGMSWSRAGAQNLLKLRLLRYDRKDWNAY